MITCPYCAEDIDDGETLCPHCHTPLDVNAFPKSLEDSFKSIYSIKSEIGRGGLATVYLATHVVTGNVVALKVVPPHFTHDLDFLNRFRREAQISLSLQHPNLIQVYEEGICSGYPYIAMRYLSGGTLSEYILKNGSLSEDKIKKIIVPVLEGLSYAHSLGIMHRDVKSSNIVFDEDFSPSLMDFGIARTVDGTKLTKTGTIICTPEYMSPEQAMGKAADVRSDIYSMGVVIYEMATGNVPFRADTLIGLIHKVVNEEHSDIRNNNSEFSDSFAASVNKALAKEPDQRFNSCSEFIESLLLAKPGASYNIHKPLSSSSEIPNNEVKNVNGDKGKESLTQIYSIKDVKGPSIPKTSNDNTLSESAPKNNKTLLIFVAIILLIVGIYVIAKQSNNREPALSDAPIDTVMEIQNNPTPSTLTEHQPIIKQAKRKTIQRNMDYKQSSKSEVKTQLSQMASSILRVYVSRGSFGSGISDTNNNSGFQVISQTRAVSNKEYGKVEITWLSQDEVKIKCTFQDIDNGDILSILAIIKGPSNSTSSFKTEVLSKGESE